MKIHMYHIRSIFFTQALLFVMFLPACQNGSETGTEEKHPNTIFIVCHLANCSYDLKLVGELLDRYPNLYADIGARFAEICAIPRAARRFLVKYQDRILYGTDMGRAEEMYRITLRLLETDDEHIYADRFSYHWPLHGLDIPGEVLEKIYRANALTIMD